MPFGSAKLDSKSHGTAPIDGGHPTRGEYKIRGRREGTLQFDDNRGKRRDLTSVYLASKNNAEPSRTRLWRQEGSCCTEMFPLGLVEVLACEHRFMLQAGTLYMTGDFDMCKVLKPCTWILLGNTEVAFMQD